MFVASDLEPEIILTIYKSRVIETKVYVRRVGNFYHLDLSILKLLYFPSFELVLIALFKLFKTLS